MRSVGGWLDAIGGSPRTIRIFERPPAALCIPIDRSARGTRIRLRRGERTAHPTGFSVDQLRRYGMNQLAEYAKQTERGPKAPYDRRFTPYRPTNRTHTSGASHSDRSISARAANTAQRRGVLLNSSEHMGEGSCRSSRKHPDVGPRLDVIGGSTRTVRTIESTSAVLDTPINRSRRDRRIRSRIAANTAHPTGGSVEQIRISNTA